MIQQYGRIIADGQFAASTTSTLVTAAAAGISGVSTLPSSIWGYAITNNDAAIALYLAFTTVSGTNFYRTLAAGACWEVSADVGVFKKLQIVAASGTPNVHLTVFG